jgi:hypothetical protein
MTGGTFFRFSVGGNNLSAQHVSYISREGAVFGEQGGTVLQHNMPGYLFDVQGYEELRTNLISYASCKEKAETRGRSHYRGLFSFEKQIEAKEAARMVEEWLKETLPNARALGFIHVNTDNIHVHMWIEARGTDEKKLQFSQQVYRTLDEKWNRGYCHFMGKEEREHLEKKRGYDRAKDTHRRAKDIYSRAKESYDQAKESRLVWAERVQQETQSREYRLVGGEHRPPGEGVRPEQGDRDLQRACQNAINLHEQSLQVARNMERADRER